MCLQRFEHKESSLFRQLTASEPLGSTSIAKSEQHFGAILGQPIVWGWPRPPLGLKENWSLEDVFTIVYTVVDDAYQKLFRTPAYFRRSPNANPVFSDSEAVTLALVAELSGYDSRLSWWDYVHKNYRHLFPRLCDRTRYGRRLARLRVAIEQMRRHLLFLLNADLSQLRVVDSFPLSVCHLRRVAGSTCPFEYSASFGYCAAKKESFYGFRVHVVTDATGVVVGYVLSAGHVHDTKGLAFLLEDLSRLEQMMERIITLLGDKGYVGAELARRIKAEFGVDLLAMRRNYEPELGASAYNELVGSARKIIETTISVLTRSFNANWRYARSLTGLVTNLVIKMTAFTLGNYLNKLLGEPVLQVTSIVN